MDEGGESWVPAFTPSPDCVAENVGKFPEVLGVVLVEDLEELPDWGQDCRGYPKINQGSPLDVIEF